MGGEHLAGRAAGPQLRLAGDEGLARRRMIGDVQGRGSPTTWVRISAAW